MYVRLPSPLGSMPFPIFAVGSVLGLSDFSVISSLIVCFAPAPLAVISGPSQSLISSNLDIRLGNLGILLVLGLRFSCEMALGVMECRCSTKTDTLRDEMQRSGQFLT